MRAVVDQSRVTSLAGNGVRAAGQRRWPRLPARGVLATTGGGIVLVVLTIALLGPLLAPHDPISQNLSEALKPPFWQVEGSLSHPLGTDQYGRDVFSRLVYG
ncbi:MAG: hypothetical protein M3509_09015, partial [Chloroflexota bacterium]|nr:hypothetical protein [Chloroflexota bacterium]